MCKKIHIEICWGWEDLVCSKIRYGVRIQSFWVGVSLPLSRKGELK